MYRIYFNNFQYFSQYESRTLAGAKDIAKSAGFEAVIYDTDEKAVMTYSPLTGFQAILYTRTPLAM